ncbi:MAG: hypothetical protein CL756_00165 [Chloroflexi bacterium]|nr:hypothetical protein [Chloroflexota bacterium]
MSEWNYTKCSKPFESVEDALEFMISRSFEGQVLQRTKGYTAVCPSYPEGFYPDAVPVASYSPDTGVVNNDKTINLILNTNTSANLELECCPDPVNITSNNNIEKNCC